MDILGIVCQLRLDRWAPGCEWDEDAERGERAYRHVASERCP